MRISDWSSDVCSSDLPAAGPVAAVVLEFRRIGFQAQAGDVAAQIVEARVGHGWVTREYVARNGSRRDRIVIPAKAGMTASGSPRTAAAKARQPRRTPSSAAGQQKPPVCLHTARQRVG